VDFLFRSLAREKGERAIAVILSGNGSDGTLGACLVKSLGGLVIAQRLDSTKYSGMPGSVIDSGTVDLQMLPSEMPARIIEFAGSFHSRDSSFREQSNRESLEPLIQLLRRETGHDFSQYKLNTFLRRVRRRQVVHGLESLESYIDKSGREPEEVRALFRDLLIGVTSFFRDPDAFRQLGETALHDVVAGKSPGATIRVWVPGCSTGEEVYSLAVLLLELQGKLDNLSKIQIFATDIDDRAIAKARLGRYSESALANISAERLARYFNPDPGPDGSVSHYVIKKHVRDLVVFSEQDLLRDPPFSKLDLISCRNLLIYFDSEMQKKILPIFHFALEPNGVLFLGGSESVGMFDDLFVEEASRCKIYRRRSQSAGKRRLLPVGFHFRYPGKQEVSHPDGGPLTAEKNRTLRNLMIRELLVEMRTVAALVNEKGDILYLHGRTGQYLEPAQGEPAPNNILDMAREGLARPLTTALHGAAKGKTVRRPRVKVKTNGDWSWVSLTVRPSVRPAELETGTPLYLVLLEPAPPGSEDNSSRRSVPSGERDDVDRVRVLKEKLMAAEEFLQAVTEELRTSNEELMVSNEEMQSVNEELQSTNEELETSKEELQSLNEELSTVNAELENKIADLSTTNNDMNNLLAGTGIGILFLDLQLRVLRFTPSATRIMNLIHTDVGRPISDLATNLRDYPHLVEDVKTVLDTLQPVERILKTQDDEWFAIQMRPYRTLESQVEGAVLTFVSVDDLKKSELSLEARFNELQGLLDSSGD
jgi:two-component system CheB/CheR fusion protein